MAAAALGLAAAAPVAAQTAPSPTRLFETAPTIVTVGYVTNTPHMFLGAGGALIHGDWGIYADYKWAHDDPRSNQRFIDGLSPTEAERDYPEDDRIRTFERWRSFNVALVRRFGGYAAYVGAGQASRDRYIEYYSLNVDRGLGGSYWLEDDGVAGTQANIMLGGLFQIAPSVVVQLGYETQPGGLTAGVMLANPFGLF